MSKHEWKVRRVDNNPHVRTVVSRLNIEEISGFSKGYNTLLRTFPPSPVLRLRTRLRRINPAMEDLSSVDALAAKEDSLSRSEVNCSFSSWRPSARLTTGRYVKDQVSAVPRRTPQLYQIAAPGFKRGDAKNSSPPASPTIKPVRCYEIASLAEGPSRRPTRIFRIEFSF